MKLEEYKKTLRLYLGSLNGNKAYYSLNHLTSEDLDMTNDRFHKLAKEYSGDVEVKDLYNKIFDILEMRIVGSVNEDRLDKELAKMMLRSFHRWDSKDVPIEEDRYAGKSDAELERMMEEMGWIRK